LEAKEMWMRRKMLGTSWIEYKSNEAVLDEDNETRTMVNTTMKRKIKLIEHLLRHNEFITIITDGKTNGKKTLGRPHKSFFEKVLRRTSLTSHQTLRRTACDRYEWLQRQVLALRS
jgi:hypothetical protein